MKEFTFIIAICHVLTFFIKTIYYYCNDVEKLLFNNMDIIHNDSLKDIGSNIIIDYINLNEQYYINMCDKRTQTIMTCMLVEDNEMVEKFDNKFITIYITSEYIYVLKKKQKITFF